MSDFGGNTLISVKQSSMSSSSPGGCYNNGNKNNYTGDGDQSNVSSGAYFALNYLGGIDCCGDGCLCDGQTLEVCYDVVLDGTTLPAVPGKDLVTSYVRGRFSLTAADGDEETDFSDPFDKNLDKASDTPTNSEGDNSDALTEVNIFRTCSHLGVALDVFKDGVSIENDVRNPASDGTYTYTWVYTMCNYAPNGSGQTACAATDIILKDSLQNYIGTIEDFEVTGISYSGGPSGGNLTSGVRTIAAINADILAETQPIKFIEGGFINNGGCDTLKVDILITPVANVSSHPCKNSFEGSYFRSTSSSICGTDGSGNKYCDGSVRGTDPDPDSDGPGDNCGTTRQRFSYTNDVGVVKTVTDISPNTSSSPANGNLDITFEMTVKNTGVVDLNTMSLEDDVQSQLTSNCYVQVLGTPTVTNIDATAAPSANVVDFTGSGSGTSIDLLSGSSSDLIKPTEEFKVTYVLEVDPNNCATAPATESNQSTVYGTDPCSRVANDLSDASLYTADNPTTFEVQSSVLPIELSGFNVEVANCMVILKWVTASELNNKYFEIQHSLDGVEFRNIGQVEGNGTSSNLNFYSFPHEDKSIGINYYRLKQVDLDGTFTYSSIVSTSNKCADHPLKIYPNPVSINESLILDYEGSVYSKTISIVISNIQGQEIKTINVEDIQASNGKIEVELTQLGTGIYFVTDNLGNQHKIHVMN
ncbi:MAG: T9SS type A sorting domain-containing protein [Saprospiraceae bacterium]